MPEDALASEPPSANNPILDEVARRLVETCHPDRIYLFGSAARGEAGADSDYDFLLVVPDDTPKDVLSGRRAAASGFFDARHGRARRAAAVPQRRGWLERGTSGQDRRYGAMDGEGQERSADC